MEQNMNSISSNGRTNIRNKNVFDNEIMEKRYHNFIQYAYEGVVEGYARSKEYMLNNPFEFFNKRHQASTINSMMLADFYSKLNSDFRVFDMTLKMGTYNMTYFLLDNKALICFKAMDKNGKIVNALTERFSDTVNGDDIKLKKSVVNELRRRGIEYQPPIFYIGFKPKENGGIEVLLVRYENNEVAYEQNLTNYFTEDNSLNINIKNKPDIGESKVG